MIKNILRAFCNWLFPSKCILCNNTDVFIDGIFCSDCFSKITIIEEPICKKCGKLFTTGMPFNTLCNECDDYCNNVQDINCKPQYNPNDIKYSECNVIYNKCDVNSGCNTNSEFTINNKCITCKKCSTKNEYNMDNKCNINSEYNMDNKRDVNSECNTSNIKYNEYKKKGRLFTEARSLFLYDKFTQKIILEIKNHANENIANACCRLLFNKYIQLFENIDFIVPVPSHWIRTLYRGFNPADIIAKELSIISGIQVNRSLRRIKYTSYQHKKSKIERLVNLNNAFACKNMSFYNKTVLLVDDVFSTGSTLNECTKALLQSGAKLVKCATIASTAADYYNNKKLI